jgi:hypothetical protein
MALLGISGGTYVIAKGIQTSRDTSMARPALVITPQTTSGTAAGAAVNLTASIANAQPGTATPQITWSLDAPALGTITPGAANTATYTAPPALPAGGLRATVRAKAAGFDEATATITS